MQILCKCVSTETEPKYIYKIDWKRRGCIFYPIYQHFLSPETLKASILSNFSNAINAKIMDPLYIEMIHNLRIF